MREANPEKYAKALTIRVSEEEHQQLKMLAVREKKSLKAILMMALSNTFPGWNNSSSKLGSGK